MEESLVNRQVRKHTRVDKFKWVYKPQGIFLIKIAYELLTKRQPTDGLKMEKNMEEKDLA